MIRSSASFWSRSDAAQFADGRPALQIGTQAHWVSISLPKERRFQRGPSKDRSAADNGGAGSQRAYAQLTFHGSVMTRGHTTNW
jgi:hypothetical protein